MTLFIDKMKEVSKTLLPVVLFVLFISLTTVSVPSDIVIRFLIGSVILLVGLTIFLWGVDTAMEPIGEHMAKEVGSSKSLIKILFLSFLLGFLITVAEPDLLILGNQIQDASSDGISSTMIVYMVSLGVGILISLGVLRLLRGMKMNLFMAIVYGIILVLGFFVSEEFLAISFDASGATTGALTTPFVLALSNGLSTFKGGKDAEENSFGLVGIMSAGPILAVMLMSILSGQRNIQGVAEEYVFSSGILGPILSTLPHVILESITALIPITVLFFVFNAMKFKLDKEEIRNILIGLGLTLLGLILFLTAVNSGFMDMGRILGMEIAAKNTKLLVFIGFLSGLIIVLVEPAVHVLGEQIEEVSGGSIPISIIRLTLSLGVGTAIAISMLRIVSPDVKLWYFLLPGFAIAVILSFFSDPIFVGIAYDAGGVASGPMTATFVLAFAQGAATSIETANVLVDGFGVIAMVAMAPVFSLMVLGLIFKYRKTSHPVEPIPSVIEEEKIYKPSTLQHCLVIMVDRGFGEQIVEVARDSGASGATIFRGRSYSEEHQTKLPLVNVEIAEEQEIVYLITDSKISEAVATSLVKHEELSKKANLAVYMTYTDANLNKETEKTEK